MGGGLLFSIYDDQHEVTGVSIFSRDVSEARSSERRVRQLLLESLESEVAEPKVVELKHGEIQEYEISPADFDIEMVSADAVAALSANSTEASLNLVKSAISNPDSPESDIVALNAGSAIYVSGVATNLANGVAMAQDESQIEFPKLKQKLSDIASLSQLTTQ